MKVQSTSTKFDYRVQSTNYKLQLYKLQITKYKSDQ